MAASFDLTLDTTPPLVVMDAPVFDTGSRLLTLPYTVDEDGVSSAVFVSDSGESIPMGITPDEFLVQVPEDTAHTGRVEVVAQDIVLNSALYQRVMTATMTVRDSVASAVARLVAVVTARPRYDARSSAGR